MSKNIVLGIVRCIVAMAARGKLARTGGFARLRVRVPPSPPLSGELFPRPVQLSVSADENCLPWLRDKGVGDVDVSREVSLHIVGMAGHAQHAGQAKFGCATRSLSGAVSIRSSNFRSRCRTIWLSTKTHLATHNHRCPEPHRAVAWIFQVDCEIMSSADRPAGVGRSALSS